MLCGQAGARRSTGRPAPGKNAACEKKRRQRARARLGQVVLRVVVHEHELIEALLETGRITERDALCRQNVEAAAAHVLKTFIARWADFV